MLRINSVVCARLYKCSTSSVASWRVPLPWRNSQHKQITRDLQKFIYNANNNSNDQKRGTVPPPNCLQWFGEPHQQHVDPCLAASCSGIALAGLEGNNGGARISDGADDKVLAEQHVVFAASALSGLMVLATSKENWQYSITRI